jgi:hypothetical protein
MTDRTAYTDLTEAELRERVAEEHMWLNAFACIHPSDDLKKEIGQWVLDKLAEEQELGCSLGISPTVILRFNKS